MKIVTKETVKGAVSENDRAGNLEFCSTLINDQEFIYFRIGKNVAKAAGLRRGDKVVFGWEESNGFGRIEPRADGWALQSGNLKADDPPLVLRVTRKREDMPLLEKIDKCTKVKVVGNSLEFYYPEGTKYKGRMDKKGKPPARENTLWHEHKAIVEGNRRPIRYRDGNPYGRRSTDS